MRSEWERVDLEWRRWIGRLQIPAIIVTVAFLLVLSHSYWLDALGRFLVVRDDPRPADAIVVLGGGPSERVEHGVRLYREGYAARMIMTGGIPVLPGFVDQTWAEMYQERAVALGVPAENVLVTPDSSSTYEDAVGTRALARQQGFRSLLVVSEPYHMRRTAIIFRQVFAETGVQLAFSPVENSWFQVERWWTRLAEVRVVSQEYLKLAYQFLAHGI